MKTTLDENGRLIPRRITAFLPSTVGARISLLPVCGLISAMRKPKQEDVKSHHYIISFDPRDRTDNLDRRPGRSWASSSVKSISRTPSHCLHPPGRTQPQRQYPCSYRNQFLRIESTASANGQTSRHGGANIAAPMPLWNISRVKSWRCATGRALPNRPLTVARNG